MRGIAWVTIAFLPATFVTSFFGMNFFNGIPGDIPFDQASRSVWLFFVVAVPISGIVLLTFYYWDKQEKKKDDLRLRVEEEAATTNQDESKTVTPVENGMEMSDLS
jgi:phosphotransferase system  glucose/maltose/N-acetylglucosamine-specific IIC component